MDNYNSFERSVFENIIYYGFLQNRGRKALGQNFLYDKNLLDKIAKAAVPIRNDVTVIEIGPGPCGLTRSLLKTFPKNKLVCIEKDIRFKPLYDNILQHTQHDLTFEYADALKYKYNFGHMAIVANLPYNVGTMLLVNWLTKRINYIEKMVLLFQKEVAERICAKPGTKQYGSVSVLAQVLCNAEHLFDIANKAFIPPPKVTSSLVLLLPKKDSCTFEQVNLEEFAKFVNQCFQFRRKIISSTLKRLYPTVDVVLLLSKFNIDENQRPETIAPSEYASLFKYLNR